jgi:ferredoxin
MKLSIDTTRCTGHGRCYEIAPSLFEDDDAGYGTVINPDVAEGDLPLARQAQMACPEQAIILGG